MKAQRKSAKAQIPGARQRKKPQPKISRGPHGMTVPEAGALIGLGRNASYEAAKAGKIPVMEFGSLMIVPRAKWLAMIGVTDAAA
jgi:hypothetical protein